MTRSSLTRIGLTTLTAVMLFESGCGSGKALQPASQAQFIPTNTGPGPTPSPSSITPTAPTVVLTANSLRTSAIILPNTPVEVKWTSTNATVCDLTANDIPVTLAGSAGNLNPTIGLPSINADTRFRVTCKNANTGLQAFDTVSVTLSASSTLPALPSFSTVVDIRANGSNTPAQINYNTSATITWTTSPVADACIVSARQTILSIDPQNTIGIASPPLTSATTFEAACLFSNGNMILDSVVIPVAAPVTTPPVHTIFVTSTSYNGNLGGILEADAKCQARANTVTALQGKTWKAIISDQNTAARDRISQPGEVRNLNGTLIALANQLFTSRSSPVLYNEFGNQISGDGHEDTWSGSTNAGTIKKLQQNTNDDACRNWSSSNMPLRIAVGNSHSQNNFLEDGDNSSCDEQKHLLCISQ